MSFISPLGLLGLIGIPVLIIIYIIKSKYREYTISSTFIWELSEKYVTKKSPLSRLSGLLSLILQILIVLFLSFSLAHPILRIPNQAKNYLFVIDNSASMNIASRFEKAKEKMIEIVDQAKKDSQFTVVVASIDGSIACISQEDKEKTKQAIQQLRVSTVASNLSAGLSIAQEYFSQDSSLNVYLFSDIAYQYTNNIELVNVADEDYNASIHSLYYTTDDSYIRLIGEVISYGKNQDIPLDLYLDGKYQKTTIVTCEADTLTEFVIETEKTDFNEASVLLNIEDDLTLDNQYILYGDQAIDQYRIMLVSDEPFYLQSILSVLGENSLKVISTGNYQATTGYDLYVFDQFAPATLPEDGAIWLFDCKDNISNAGFVSQGETTIENGAGLTLAKQSNEVYQTLAQNLTGNGISVYKYMQYTLISSFTTIMEYASQPMIFAGINPNGNRQVTFSFALSDSNFPVKMDFVILFNNMLKYSIPQLCSQTKFNCGDDLVLNVLPNCESIRINAPSGYSTYLSLTDLTTSYHLNEIGTYEIEALINQNLKNYKIYVSFPEEEENPLTEEESIELSGIKDDTSFDSSYDLQWLMIVLLVIVCILEWEVYVYEQREIRSY